MRAKFSTEPKRILDFDVETVAAGFADPQWVPQRITVIAWSWIGKREVKHATRLEGPIQMFSDFLRDYREADMVTGHNLLRFDLPVLNADLIRVGFESLGPVLVQDTMRLPKTKGLKKGQDNLARLLDVRNKKMALDWQHWDEAYQWDRLIAGQAVDWDIAVRRCVTDVKQHKKMRQQQLRWGLLKPPILWKP